MKLNIMIGFMDKYTGENYEAGTVHEFEGKRAAELLKDKRHLVECDEEPNTDEGIELTKLTKNQLIEFAALNGFDIEGAKTKDEIIEMIEGEGNDNEGSNDEGDNEEEE